VATGGRALPTGHLRGSTVLAATGTRPGSTTVIFVTVGTTDFDELIRQMDALAPTLGEPCIAQIGRGSYEPAHLEHFRFAPSLDPYYERARIVIAHGGLGTMIEVLQRGLPLIGLSNPDRYDRHVRSLLPTSLPNVTSLALSARILVVADRAFALYEQAVSH
jgi:hypothetical protein